MTDRMVVVEEEIFDRQEAAKFFKLGTAKFDELYGGVRRLSGRQDRHVQEVEASRPLRPGVRESTGGFGMNGTRPDAWSVQTGIDLDAMLAANAGWIERVRRKTKRDYQRDKPVLQRVFESLRTKYEAGFSTSSYRIAEDLQLAQSVVYRKLRKLVSYGLAETFLTHGKHCFRPTGLEPTKGFDWNE
ncbi:hypothetical protein PL921_06070 [Bifidobacterium adolescentis]|nr:hypothetical protein [Bifidobacterium adolescentis]